MRISTHIGVIIIFGFCGCKSLKSHEQLKYSNPGDHISFIDSWINYAEEYSFDKELVLMPGALLSTSGQGRLIFTKKVSIVGDVQVFDGNVNVFFAPGVISELNPDWFGAKGWDDGDDTQPFLKTFEIAQNYSKSINIRVPVGRYIIKKSLELKGQIPNERAINLVGNAIGGNSISGSCLQWHGDPYQSMIIINNNTSTRIENVEFACYSSTNLKHNVELRPFVNQVHFENCFFSGCRGPEAANVNLNHGNNRQVSEISFENCIFRSYTEDNVNWITPSAVTGGLANTKNFYFEKCSFLGYVEAAININISDILKVSHCTFAVNNIDIVCGLCNALITSNYSEQSKSFFKAGTSSNMSFTTLMNNYFDGHSEDDYVIRNGSGGLVLINNSFGGTGWSDLVNRINWSENPQSSITSISNFYRNDPDVVSPFYTDQSRIRRLNIKSIHDLIGKDGSDFIRLDTVRQ